MRAGSQSLNRSNSSSKCAPMLRPVRLCTSEKVGLGSGWRWIARAQSATPLQGDEGAPDYSLESGLASPTPVISIVGVRRSYWDGLDDRRASRSFSASKKDVSGGDAARRRQRP